MMFPPETGLTKTTAIKTTFLCLVLIGCDCSVISTVGVRFRPSLGGVFNEWIF